MLHAAPESGRCPDLVKLPYFAENKTDAKALIGTDLQLSPNWTRNAGLPCNYHASTSDSSKAVAITVAGLVVQVRRSRFLCRRI
jgi:hypothetical protein